MAMHFCEIMANNWQYSLNPMLHHFPPLVRFRLAFQRLQIPGAVASTNILAASEGETMTLTRAVGASFLAIHDKRLITLGDATSP